MKTLGFNLQTSLSFISLSRCNNPNRRLYNVYVIKGTSKWVRKRCPVSCVLKHPIRIPSHVNFYGWQYTIPCFKTNEQIFKGCETISLLTVEGSIYGINCTVILQVYSVIIYGINCTVIPQVYSVIINIARRYQFTHRRGQHLRNKLYRNTLGLFRNNLRNKLYMNTPVNIFCYSMNENRCLLRASCWKPDMSLHKIRNVVIIIIIIIIC